MTQIPPPSPPPPFQQPGSLNYHSPYGDPRAEAWVKDNLLHLRDGVVLPMCCIGCGGSEALTSKRRALAWTPSWMYILLLFPGLLIGGIIILITQKKAKVTTFSCADCRRKNLIRGLLTFAIFVAGIGCFFLAAAVRSSGGVFVILGLLVILGSLVFGIVMCRPFTVVRIEPPFAILKGIHPEFLRKLAG